MEDIDELLRRNICNILNSVSYGTVNGVINAVKAAGIVSLSDLQRVQEEDLFLVLQPIQRQQLITAWSKQNIENDKKRLCIKEETEDPFVSASESCRDVTMLEDFRSSVDWDKIRQNIKKEKVDTPTSASESSGDVTKLDDINSVDCDKIKQSIKKENVDPPAPATESSGDVAKLDDIINNVEDNKIRQSIKQEILDPSCSASESSGNVTKLGDFTNSIDSVEKRQSIKKENVDPVSSASESSIDVTKLNNFTNSSPTSGVSNSLSRQQWDRGKQRVLMQIYAKYKTEFDSSSGTERLKVWGKIADEVQQKCLLSLNNMQCCMKILNLKSEYENIKTKYLANQKTNFVKEAEKASESFNPDGDERRQSIKKENVDSFGYESENSGDVTMMDDLTNNTDCDKIRQSIKKENVDHFTSVLENSGDVTMLDDFTNIEAPSTSSGKRNKGNRINAFKLLSAYGKHKKEFSQSNVDEQAVWKLIANEVTDRDCLDCDGLQCRNKLEELRCGYERIKNGKITSQLQAKFLAEARETFGVTENPGTSTTVTSNSLSSQQCKWDKEKQRVLMQVYAKYKTEFDSSFGTERQKVWRKIADDVRQQCFVNFNYRQCCMEILNLKSQYINIKTKHLDNQNNDFIKEAEKAFGSLNSGTSPAGTSNNMALQKSKEDREKQYVLMLQVYTKYKTELDSCPRPEKLKVWEKIADEVRQQCSLSLSDIQCCMKILNMKSRYRKNKTKQVNQKTDFMKEAEKAFEPLYSVDLSVEQSSNLHLEGCGKTNKRYHLILLQVYSKHKTGVCTPDCEIQNVWEEIATEMREIYFYDCSDLLCRTDVIRMKNDCESFKMHIGKMEKPYYFDAAQQVFYFSIYPVKFSDDLLSQILLRPYGKKNKRYNLILLQLYGKYKTNFQHPHSELQSVWQKIATEIREIFFYDCTDLQCRSDLIQMKKDYESFKMQPNKIRKPFYFKEAEKVLKITMYQGSCNNNQGVSSSNVAQCNIPHITESSMQEGNFAVKVSNLPRKVADKNLRRLFRQCGEIVHYYLPRDQAGNCKGVAFIGYRRLKEAQQALQHNGYNYNSSFLKVELVDPSEISDSSMR